MKRSIPWVIAVAALIGFGASFSELQRVRGRFGEVTRHHFHDHQDVRQFMIRAALEGQDAPIVVIGDSITEMSRLPETIAGHPVVNAGIGGATIEDFTTLAPKLFAGFHPARIVIVLGANNDAMVGPAYVALLSTLKKFAPRLLAAAVPAPDGAALKNAQIKAAADREGVAFVETPMPDGSFLTDHTHLNAAGYRVWTPALVAAISTSQSF
jgi:hypothetical protein